MEDEVVVGDKAVIPLSWVFVFIGVALPPLITITFWAAGTRSIASEALEKANKHEQIFDERNQVLHRIDLRLSRMEDRMGIKELKSTD